MWRHEMYVFFSTTNSISQGSSLGFKECVERCESWGTKIMDSWERFFVFWGGINGVETQGKHMKSEIETN